MDGRRDKSEQGCLVVSVQRRRIAPPHAPNNGGVPCLLMLSSPPCHPTVAAVAADAAAATTAELPLPLQRPWSRTEEDGVGGGSGADQQHAVHGVEGGVLDGQHLQQSIDKFKHCVISRSTGSSEAYLTVRTCKRLVG